MHDELGYDWFSYYYDALYAHLLDYAADVEFVLALARKYLQLMPAAVLDVGCGTGSHLGQFARRGIQVFGVDTSIVALETARLKLTSEARLLLQDMTILDTGFEIDLAVSMLSSLGYLRDTNQLLQTLRRIRSVVPSSGGLIVELWQPAVLPSDGEVTVTVPFADHQLTRTSVFLPSAPSETSIRFEFVEHAGPIVLRGPVSEEHHLRLFRPDEVRQFLSRAGFQVVTMVSGGGFQNFTRRDRPIIPSELRAIVIAR